MPAVFNNLSKPTYDRNDCEHELCFYSKNNKSKPSISYQAVLDFTKACAEKAFNLGRSGIEQSFVKELQMEVNRCESIDSIFSKKVVRFYNFN